MAELKLLIKDDVGKVYTLSDNVYVGPVQPISNDVLLWVDTTKGCFDLKFKHNDEWVYSGGCTTYSEVYHLQNITPAKFIKAELSDNWQFSFNEIPAAGTECHIIAHNSQSYDITITIPTGANYINLTDDALTISPDGYVEINTISDGSKLYIRSIK